MTVEPREDVPSTYRVFYNVDPSDPTIPSCDCKSGCYTDRKCTHIRAAEAYRDGQPVPFWRDR